MTGFEPARVSPLTPEISVSTGFTTSAVLYNISGYSIICPAIFKKTAKGVLKWNNGY